MARPESGRGRRPDCPQYTAVLPVRFSVKHEIKDEELKNHTLKQATSIKNLCSVEKMSCFLKVFMSLCIQNNQMMYSNNNTYCGVIKEI